MQKQRPPRIISGPPEGHVLLVFSSQHQSATHLVRLRAHSYQSILAVPFGHCQYNAPLSRLELNFFHKTEVLNTLGRRCDCRGHLVFSVWAFCGVKPHKKCPQVFWRLRICFLRPKSRKLWFSILGKKTVPIDVFWSQEYGKMVFWTKN